MDPAEDDITSRRQEQDKRSTGRAEERYGRCAGDSLGGNV